jgi:alcohol dehydrogenase (cytochrome c)
MNQPVAAHRGARTHSSLISLSVAGAMLIPVTTPSRVHAQAPAGTNVPISQPAAVAPAPQGGRGGSGRGGRGGGAGRGGGLSPNITLPPWPASGNPLDKIAPVTDAMLQNPSAADWLTWRRTWDAQGFSPLQQIDRTNVSDLRVVWSWSLPAGPNESTPLVHDGVIFVHGYGDRVQALDAATGNLLWQYTRQLPQDVMPSVKRNIAIYGDRLLISTSDFHVVSLDIKTGKVVWDREIADRATALGVRLTSGPLVAKGKVMVGTSGGATGGCFIVALDVATGAEAWRFHTVAQPAEPGGDSWNGLPAQARAGAGIWTAGSYDPVLNLAYFGTSPAQNPGSLLSLVNQPGVSPGVSNDALYTDSTLAINPDTGKLVWHFQHMPNDQWGYDWAFERQLVRLPVNGATRTVVVTEGKQAVYDVLEADTGKYVSSGDLGVQNVVASIDPKTGSKILNSALIPRDGETTVVCPSTAGAKNWLPASYNPVSRILYTSLNESCMDVTASAGGGPRRTSLRPAPGSDGKYGRLEAINLETKKVVWTDRQRAPASSGVLATAGGIIFLGAIDRVIKAFDDASGTVLWQTRLNDVPSSAPISYSVNGKQYVAVVTGNGGEQASTFPLLVPEIRNPPDRSSTLWVFALPEKAIPAK